MSQLKLKNSTSRNAFDLSRKNAFTAKIGELLPVACIECIPGDKIKGRVQHFTRTVPVNTAAFTRIREYYDWFFVPTNLLWNKFNTFVTQMVDNNQHATSITGSQVLTNMHPYFTTNQLATYVNAVSKANQNNIFNYNRGKLSAKLLHYLGYGDFFDSAKGGNVQTFRTNANLNPFPLLAYQKIYQDYFRNSQWENAYAPAFNIDYISGASDSLNIPVSTLQSQSRTTENMFDLRYSNWNKDLFMGLLPNAQYGEAASINLSTLFQYGAMSPYNSTLIVQNEDGTAMPANVGMVTSSDSPTGVFPNSRSLHPSGSSQPVNLILSTFQIEQLRQALGLSTSETIDSAFSVLALRQAEALQKWREITQSQQQDYKNQIEAHFGVSMSDAYSERCKYVDGSVSSLDISEVTNTNLADQNAAEIAGKGVGVGDGNINFSSDVHGYLMCIYHAVPLLDYANDGVRRTNLKTMVTDYAIPEFDKTGMVQVPLIELTNNPANPTFTAQLLGYAPRYYDYKVAIDEVHGGFYNGGENLENWVAPVDSTYIQKYVEAMHGNGSSLSYQWFKINPAVLNPIFGVQVTNDYTNNPTGTYDDQLYINASVELTAVRNLDRNGLPY